MKIILDTSSSNQEFINGLEELLESSDGVTTQIIVHSEDECGIAADAIGDTAKRLGVEITWDKNVVLEDIPDIVDFVEPNPFGRGDEPACLAADAQTAQDLIDQAAANGLTKTELLVAIQALYGDADEAIDWPDVS